MKNREIWVNYKKRFIAEAQREKYSAEKIEDLLEYAKKLYDQQLPIIYDGIHLSRLLGFQTNFIYGITNSPSYYYRTYKIPKKQIGKYREISEPLPNLKKIQFWINEKILKNFKINPYIKSYIKNRSIKDNAKFHKNKKIVLTLDIEKYFPSFSYQKIYSFFIKIGYTESVAVALSKLCYFNGLPQGAPTSPTLSNLLTEDIDKRIVAFCKFQNLKNNKINYTRYADDLTFSGDFRVGKVIKVVKEILSSEGFNLNEEKIRVRRKNSNQEVTGITVNQVLRASKKMRNSVRQEVYYIKKYGMIEHIKRKMGNEENIGYHYDRLIGVCNFIIYINSKEDEEYVEYKNFLLSEKKLAGY
ncbi:reverse transcriptase family protein [Fusobacterium varium]|uniref:reverse transcriptase family protein n=1 Tax=Fusobacterium varium TaxID=856 RepID=UPI00242E123E|nr:reverse transcriptase family protein [Fusobacterium varium]